MHDGRGVWGSAIMSVMTAQQVLPMTMVPGVVRVGAAADLLEDSGGGEVFIHGNLTYAWSGGDQALRRLTAVQLVEMQVAKVGDVADAFGVDTATLLSLIHISEPTRLGMISYAVFCLKKK